MRALLKGLLTKGRKGSAYDKALCALFLLTIASGLSTHPLAWSIGEDKLNALLMALAGILATFVGGNGIEHYVDGKAVSPSDPKEPEEG